MVEVALGRKGQATSAQVSWDTRLGCLGHRVRGPAAGMWACSGHVLLQSPEEAPADSQHPHLYYVLAPFQPLGIRQ